MKLLKLPFLMAIVLLSSVLYSQKYQKGLLIDTKENTYSGKFLIDHDNAVLRFKSKETSKVFNYNQIKSLVIDAQDVVKKQLNNQEVLLLSLVKGRASLYQKNKTEFYIETLEKELVAFDNSKNKSLLPRILNVAFQDCSSIRETIARTSHFSRSNLINLTELYNSCQHSAQFELTEKEIEESNQFRADVYWFYAGAGLTVNQLNFGSAEKSISFQQFSLGVLGSPGFLGSLQNKVFVGSDVSYGVASSQALSTATRELDIKVHSFVYTFELQYNFNSSANFQPFLGGGINFHADRFKGTLNDQRFNSTDSGFDFNLKAGVLFRLGKQNLAFSFRYIPEYNSDASFRNQDGDFVPLQLKNNYFISRLEFHF